MHPTAPLKKGYKFRLYPTPTQEQELNRIFGHARHVRNLVLTATQEAYSAHQANPTHPKPSVNYFEFNRQLTQLKQERPYLYEVSSTVLQQKLMDLDRAYQNFFGRRGGCPKFKKRHGPQSVRFTSSGFRVRNDQLFLANCGAPYKVRWSRPLPSVPTQVTISRDPDGRYYASFLCTYTPTEFRLVGDAKLKLNQRTWTCPWCGAQHDRDTNAALNLLQEARRITRAPGQITLM